MREQCVPCGGRGSLECWCSGGGCCRKSELLAIRLVFVRHCVFLLPCFIICYAPLALCRRWRCIAFPLNWSHIVLRPHCILWLCNMLCWHCVHIAFLLHSRYILPLIQNGFGSWRLTDAFVALQYAEFIRDEAQRCISPVESTVVHVGFAVPLNIWMCWWLSWLRCLCIPWFESQPLSLALLSSVIQKEKVPQNPTTGPEQCPENQTSSSQQVTVTYLAGVWL